MGIGRKFLITAVACAALGVLSAPAASAGTTFDFDARFRSDPAHDDTAYVSRLDKTQDSTLRVLRGAMQVDVNDFSNNRTTIHLDLQLQPGDVIEAYQPALGGNPPSGPPNDSFTIPAVGVSASAGNPTVSGTADPAATVLVQRDRACPEKSDALIASRSADAYGATFPEPILAGELVTAGVKLPSGDRVFVESRTPGETICAKVSTDGRAQDFYPGSPPSIVGDYLRVDGMTDLSIADVRVLVRRGGSALIDYTETGSDGTEISLTPDQRPVPGDVVEVFRPAGAASPAASWTVPQASAVHDAGSDRIAVTAPVGLRVGASACSVFTCSGGASRTVFGPKAGRTLFEFGKADASGPAHDIRADDWVRAYWESSDQLFEYSFNSVPGDLTPPSLRVTVARVLRLARLSRTPVRIRTNEASRATLKLTTKIGRRTVTVATGKRSLRAGTSRVKLKLSRAGKRLSKARRKGTLTTTLKDAAGNLSTSRKRVKLR